MMNFFLNRISLGVFAIWSQINYMSYVKLLVPNLPGKYFLLDDKLPVLNFFLVTPILLSNPLILIFFLTDDFPSPLT